MKGTRGLVNDYSPRTIDLWSNVLLSLNSTPFVTGLADVPATLYPYIVETDEHIGAQMNGHDIAPDKQEIRFYDDGAVIIYSNGVRYIFKSVAANGTSVKLLMAEYDNPDHPMPAKVSCDSLKRICKETQALTIFWGNVYSVTEGIAESRLHNGVTKETKYKSSLLFTRGWEMDCCTGEFKLKLFFQSMRDRESISFTKTLSAGWGNPCPIPDDCPACKEKCEKDKEMKEKNK